MFAGKVWAENHPRGLPVVDKKNNSGKNTGPISFWVREEVLLS